MKKYLVPRKISTPQRAICYGLASECFLSIKQIKQKFKDKEKIKTFQKKSKFSQKKQKNLRKWKFCSKVR